MDDRRNPPAARSGWRRAWPLLLIVAVTAAAYLSGVHRYLSFEALVESRERLREWVTLHYFASLFAFVGAYIVFVALSLPGALLLTIMSGFLYGVIVGGVATTIGATIGATLLFLAASTSLGEGLRSRAGPWLERFREGFQKDATSYLLFLRLVPVFPFWLVNLAPALLGVNVRTFVWTTAVGIVPGTFAYAFAGAGLDSVVAAHRAAKDACMAAGAAACDMQISPGQLVTRELVLALAALGCVALLPVLIKRFRRPRPDGPA
ncbi:MAG: TVP38/TMEM64 family protein [Beijerinckiaceae bacterium]|nr:TVP38/TMEM64 family protein [Beijerinckiaceae bacterium]MDO9440250.1 TVP38/TMEM64 family protein [Beijerinckiaceae bacterium]